MNNSKIFIASGIMAFAVIIGAFGTHELKSFLTPYRLDIFKTANFYHFIHGIALFITVILNQVYEDKKRNYAFYFFIIGIALFSGSLYILSLQPIFSNIPAWLGAITPIGGLAFIVGWGFLGFQAVRKR